MDVLINDNTFFVVFIYSDDNAKSKNSLHFFHKLHMYDQKYNVSP